jgi:hypothetical protein
MVGSMEKTLTNGPRGWPDFTRYRAVAGTKGS